MAGVGDKAAAVEEDIVVGTAAADTWACWSSGSPASVAETQGRTGNTADCQDWRPRPGVTRRTGYRLGHSGVPLHRFLHQGLHCPSSERETSRAEVAEKSGTRRFGVCKRVVVVGAVAAAVVVVVVVMVVAVGNDAVGAGRDTAEVVRAKSRRLVRWAM